MIIQDIPRSFQGENKLKLQGLVANKSKIEAVRSLLLELLFSTLILDHLLVNEWH
jgi:hypothetical protein